MRYYQAYTDFTAQSRTVRALMSMYELLLREPPVQFPLTPIVVFLAFSIESYLNSIGSRVIPFWDDIERLPWKQKVSVIHKAAGKEPNWGQEPLQFASEVFRLRDKLAHGKPERVVGPRMPEGTEPEKIALGEKLQPEWYNSINRQWVVEAKERFRLLTTYLALLHGIDESDHLLSSTGSIELHDEPDA